MTPELTKKAVRDLARLPKVDAIAVLDGIERFCATGIGDVVKLHDITPATWRLRIGKWRALYRPEGELMLVIAIVDRRDAYR